MRIIDYLLLSVSVLLATGCNILYHKLGGERYNPFLFSAVSSCAWAIMLLGGSGGDIKLIEIIYGVVYGVIQALFLYFKMRSMNTGPVSITTVVGNCSMLLSTIFGVVYFKESVDFWGILGVLGILLSVLLCLDAKSDMKTTAKWKFFCVGFFLFAAATGIVFKLFSKTGGNGNNMMAVSAFTMVVLMGALSLSRKGTCRFGKRLLLYAIVAGVMSCGYNRLNLYLSGALPSVVFFPIFNGAVVILATTAGIFFFKERLSKRQYLGVLIGVLAIILQSGILV